MKVLFIARSTLFTNRGGDTIQITNTEKQLKLLGVEVEIRLSNENIDYRNFDLIHFFNVIRPADILMHARKSQKPYVISPIFVDYSEFERKARTTWLRALFYILPSPLIEYLKVLGRWLINGEAVVSKEYLWLGHYRAIKKVLKNAKLLLPNSLNEYKRLNGVFPLEKAFFVVPNGVDLKLFGRPPEIKGRKDELILCVGRIEGLKNQLNLIRALKDTKFSLVIIGAPATNQLQYYEECVREANGKVRFIGNVSQTELIDFYQLAKVHVLPSWFETTGLSSLEAAVMGCNIVITPKGDTVEYFEKLAYYCEPDSIASIRNAVDRAAGADFNEGLRERIILNYTWEIAARKTLEAYNVALYNQET